MNILSASEVRELDRAAIAGGMPGIELMEKAGRGFVEVLARRFPGIGGMKVVIFAGKGNNGGDGLVIARYLRALGTAVKAVILSDEMKGDAGINLRRARKTAGLELVYEEKAGLGRLHQYTAEADIVVDAIFGTGFKGRISGRLRHIVDMVNKASFVAACDIPSGVNGDTGAVTGGIAVNADLTITFAYPKKGMFIDPGRGHAGNIEVVEIGLTGNVGSPAEQMITREEVRQLLSRRRKDSHKKDYGHVLVIAGSPGMTGAAALACAAALRSGAGLVTAGIPRGLNTILEVKLTEAMTLPLPETNEGTLGLEALPVIRDFIRKRKPDVIAMGPGLSANGETRELVRKVVRETGLPCVLDADGINAFAEDPSGLKGAGDLVITPHPGEMSRLLKGTVNDRIGTATRFAKKFSLTCVLKGFQTVVSDGEKAYLNPTGNPGMASGGTGDVLTGMIAGLFCQVPEPRKLNAALAGVYLHGMAGDVASREKGEMSLTASDVIEGIPGALGLLA